MAKKRKKEKEKEEEYEFKPPDFSEEEFLKRELRDTKTALATVFYAGVVAVAAGLISMVSRDLLGVAFLLVIVGIVSLKWVYPLFKVNVKSFTRRNWAGNIGIYFFTFLAVWVLMLNPPFTDNSKPSIQKLIVWVERPQGAGTNLTGAEYRTDSGWAGLWGEDVATLVHRNTSYTINITARVADNGGLKSVQISLGSTSNYSDMQAIGNNRYGYSLSDEQQALLGSNLVFYIKAVDKVGNERIFFPGTWLLVNP